MEAKQVIGITVPFLICLLSYVNEIHRRIYQMTKDFYTAVEARRSIYGISSEKSGIRRKNWGSN
jgi:hypothetical protein